MSPLKRLCHRAVEVVNKLQDTVFQISLTRACHQLSQMTEAAR